MKVLYDHQIFNRQMYGGISRYFYELMDNFRLSDDLFFELSLKYSNNHYISENNISNHNTFFKHKNFYGKGSILKFLYLINKANSIKTLKKSNYDFFHPTYYDTYFLEYIKRKPFVLTVHDMIHEKFPEYFKNFSQLSYQKKLCAQNATRIIAVSKNTKKDIIELYHIEESKIDVIYHGNSLKTSDKPINFILPQKYLLFVGDRIIYKNFLFFLKSILEIFRLDSDIHLVCIGGPSFSIDEISLFKDSNIQQRIHHYRVSDDNLMHLYKNAIAFIFPSLYEGFGIPILEAFASGCPVIASNTSSLPEVAGDAALYIDPYNQSSIFESVKEIINNENLRTTLIEKGYKRIADYSWSKAAAETKNVYKKVL